MQGVPGTERNRYINTFYSRCDFCLFRGDSFHFANV